MYRVVIPGSGMVLGVFADYHKAADCYRKNYTTAVQMQPVIETF